jgi:hypothetical protein
MESPNEDTSLLDFPWVVVRFRCHFCRRRKDARLAGLARDFGEHTTLKLLLSEFIKRCRWDPRNPARKPQKYGMKCGAYMPDIGRVGPPDLPPALLEWRVIEGSKGDMLPGEPMASRRRRRVGGEE